MRIALSILLSALLAGCATPPAATPRPFEGALRGPNLGPPGYLTGDEIDGVIVLGPPPAPDSPYGRADRQTYDETRALQGTPRWQMAIQDNDLWAGGALKRFSCALGVDVSEAHTPVTLTILRKIETDARALSSRPKAHFARPRPVVGNDKAACLPRADWMQTNGSWPSAHSMTLWAWALILTEAAPAKATDLLRIGREGGESRVVCGVHFPSDEEAGRTLTAGMVAYLHSHPAFLADLARAKAEIATAPRPAACPG